MSRSGVRIPGAAGTIHFAHFAEPSAPMSSTHPAFNEPDRWAARIRAGREALLGLAFAHVAHEAGNNLGPMQMRLETLLGPGGAGECQEKHLKMLLTRVESLISLHAEWRTWLDEVPPLTAHGVELAMGLTLFTRPFARHFANKNIHLVNDCERMNHPAETYGDFERAVGLVLVKLMALFPPMACDLRLACQRDSSLLAALHPREPDPSSPEGPRFFSRPLDALEEIARLDGVTLTAAAGGVVLTIPTACG